MTEQVTQNLRLLKAIVIGLGVLIVAGVILLVITIATRSSALLKAKPLAQATLTLPEGVEIADMAVGDGRLVLRLAGPNGEEIVIVDPSTGALQTRLFLSRGAAD